MKPPITSIALAFIVLAACDRKPPTTGAQSPSAPIGAWIITSKPAWVTSSWLDHRSDVWQFLPGGTCILGTATGSYQSLPNNQLKVQLPMQAATPGFTAVFSFTVRGDSLTMNNLAESTPVVLANKEARDKERREHPEIEARKQDLKEKSRTPTTTIAKVSCNCMDSLGRQITLVVLTDVNIRSEAVATNNKHEVWFGDITDFTSDEYMGQSVIKIRGGDSLSGADAIYFDAPDKRNTLLKQAKAALTAWRARYGD